MYLSLANIALFINKSGLYVEVCQILLMHPDLESTGIEDMVVLSTPAIDCNRCTNKAVML